MDKIIVTLPGEKPHHIELVVDLDLMIEKLERISYNEKMKANREAKND